MEASDTGIDPERPTPSTRSSAPRRTSPAWRQRQLRFPRLNDNGRHRHLL
ncbi:MAG: hypothetical protein ACLVL7_04795 [Anaerotruncus massiliensis (ex Togo et al. 2019)]